jgi:hypothetical protein
MNLNQLWKTPVRIPETLQTEVTLEQDKKNR